MSVYYKEKGEWLDYSIQSMINQTIKPNEFVLVEDGQLTEELDKVIEKYTKEYKPQDKSTAFKRFIWHKA